MNPHSATKTLNNFLYEGYGNNLFRHINTHVATRGIDHLVSVGPSTEVGMVATQGLTFNEYIRLISEERYSIILSDYSLISIEWETKKDKITRHRYMYIPCPIRAEVLAERPEEMEIADYLQQLDKKLLVDDFLSHGYIRFDYTMDIVNSSIHHPLAHLTLISSDCRIALRSPISASDFLTFIFDNFYPQDSHQWLDFRPHLKTLCEDTIRVDETARMHLYWADEI